MRTNITKDGDTKSICRLTPDNRQQWCHELMNKSRSVYSGKETIQESIKVTAEDDTGEILCAGSIFMESNQRTGNVMHESWCYLPLVARMDKSGNWLWQRNLDIHGTFRVARSLQNGDVVAAGERVVEFGPLSGIIRKGMAAWVGSNGDLQRYVEFEEADEINAMVVLPDKSVVFFGSKQAESRMDTSERLYLARVDADGRILDQRKIQITDNPDNMVWIRDAISANDGGFLVVGIVLLKHSLVVAKLGPDGALIWKKMIKPDPNAGFFSIGPVVNAIAQLADGRILVIGDIHEQEVAGYAVCLDSAGNQQWLTPTLLDNRPCRFQAISPNQDGTFTLYGANEDKKKPNTIQAAILTSEGCLKPIK